MDKYVGHVLSMEFGELFPFRCTAVAIYSNKLQSPRFVGRPVREMVTAPGGHTARWHLPAA